MRVSNTGKNFFHQPSVLLSFGALCISFAPIFVKLLGRDLLGPTAIAFWRTLLGALILFIWITIKKETYKMPRSVLGFSILAGFIFFLDLSFWHRSILYSGAGMATILANTQVFWIALIGFIIFKERLRFHFWGAVVTAFIGVSLLVGVGSKVGFTPDYVKGIVFGLLTGIVYSLYITTLKKAGHREECPGIMTLMAWTSLFSSIFFGLSLLFEEVPYMPPNFFSLFILFALALVAQAVGWWAITSSLPKLKASQSGLLLLLQPTLATVWGGWFFSEQLTGLQIIGAVVTLTAIYFGSVRLKEKKVLILKKL
ncbi:MAG: DMT family transporter [Candidatus Zixiibacteriota bacterium]